MKIPRPSCGRMLSQNSSCEYTDKRLLTSEKTVAISFHLREVHSQEERTFASRVNDSAFSWWAVADSALAERARVSPLGSGNVLSPALGGGYTGASVSKPVLIFDLCLLLCVSFTLRK